MSAEARGRHDRAQMGPPVRVVIADDHPLFRDGVAHTLGAEQDLAVVGQAATADEAVQLAERLRPDVLLLDLGMPGGGLEAARRVASASPDTRVVVLTVSEEQGDLTAALEAGARAYVLKGVAGKELAGLIRDVQVGEGYVSPGLAARMLSSRGTRGGGALQTLTERERAILEMVARGDRNREIGATLGLSEPTVKHYVSTILQKLHARSRLEAALLAKQGLVAGPAEPGTRGER